MCEERSAAVAVPRDDDACIAIARSLCDDGRFIEAAQACFDGLGREPASLPLHHALASVLARAGLRTQAEAVLRKARTLDPHAHETHRGWPQTPSTAGRQDGEQAHALLELGVMLSRQGQTAEAKRQLQASLCLAPCLVRAWNELGYLLQTQEAQYQAAQVCFRRAVELEPAYYACLMLGKNHYRLCEYEDALAMCGRALQFSPRDRSALALKGATLWMLGRFGEAIVQYEDIMAMNPDDPDAIFGLAALYLLTGAYAKGWPLLYRYHLRRTLPGAEWQGEPLDGKTLLIHQQFGFGDVIQFIAAMPLIRSGRIILAVQPDLVRLFSTAMPGPFELRTLAEIDTLAYDYYTNEIDMLRLIDGMHVLRCPSPAPYLRADPALEAVWRERLGVREGDGVFRIGIAWSGNAAHLRHGEDMRATTLADWLPLAGLPGVSLYSLQKDGASSQVLDVPQLRIVDLSREREDFADLAAIMSALDLVISIDTSVAHLAGALGRPVWTLLPFLPEWRWRAEGNDCPWYPGMRLFRRGRHQSWSGLLTQVRDELAVLMRSGGA